MDLPYGPAIWVSLAGSALLVRLAPQYSVSESHLKTFGALFTIVFASALLWKAIIYPKCFSPLRNLPRPPGGSFLNGHGREILAMDTGGPMLKWMTTVPNDGLIYYTSFLNSERVILASPQAIHEVLQINAYDFVKPPFVRRALLGPLGNGLVLAEGDDHKTQRKNLLPAFSYRHIKDLSPLFWSKGTELVNTLAAIVNQAPAESEEKSAHSSIINLAKWFDRTTFDIIGLACLGHDFGSLQDENSEFIQGYRTIFKPTKSRIAIFILGFFLPPWLVRFIPVAHNRNVKEGSYKIKKAAHDIMRLKQEKLERGDKNNEVDILSIAFDSGLFSPEGLVNQAMTFLAAGHETSATALTWSSLELCRNPAMQSRIREEVRSILPSPDSTAAIDPDLIGKCQYLVAFCNEVLRLHSPVGSTIRQNIRATTILGHRIPKGTSIIVPIWGMNRSTQQWGDDALEFNPDRWLPAASAKSGSTPNGPYSFMTFLHGPRSCIGSSFSRAEVLSILAILVGRFQMELVDKDRLIEIQSGVTAKIKNGLEVRLKPLEGW